MKTLKNKVLTWLYNYIEKEAHRQSGIDIKCPCCQEWFSVSSIKHNHQYVSDFTFGCSVKCGQCGTVSYWDLATYPAPVRCDENGGII